MVLQYETSPGTFTSVTRRSGRLVDDGDLITAYTPEPLQRSGPQTHVWVTEWQAVPWLGAPNVDALDARGGVPLGRYRFHVEGSGWTLDSQPFTVVAGGLMTSGTRSGSSINVTAKWNAPKGWRLMDIFAMSNQPVPLRSQSITVKLLDSGGATLSTSIVNLDVNGAGTVTNNSSAATVSATDAFGNPATAPVQ